MKYYRHKILGYMLAALVAFALFPILLAGTFTSTDSKLVIDLAGDWQSASTDDADTIFNLKQGNSKFTVTNLKQDLRDFYLKARVQDDVSSLKSKGYTIVSELKSFSIHSVATLYYAEYNFIENGVTKNNRSGFFTYDGNSYSLVATGISDSDFNRAIYSLRKVGEPAPKPPVVAPPPQPKRAKTAKAEKQEPEPVDVQADIEESSSAVETQQADVSSDTTGGSAAPKKLEAVKAPDAVKPLLARKPLPLGFWFGLIALWCVGAMGAKIWASKLVYPKLTPLPKEVPPDFFFPFIVIGFADSGETNYSIISRHGQRLSASYARLHETYMAVGLYGMLVLEVLWSLSAAFGVERTIVEALLAVPAGNYLVSYPEAIFALIFLAGVIMRSRTPRLVGIYDRQHELLFEAFPHTGSILIRDGKGKEVARLKRTVSVMSGRGWRFLDADSQPVFDIVDDQPKLFWLRRLFGRQGGYLRARYSLMVKDRRVGFVLNDTRSPHSFQLHFEFDYGRLAHPAQILLSVIYAEAIDRDFPYPWFV